MFHVEHKKNAHVKRLLRLLTSIPDLVLTLTLHKLIILHSTIKINKTTVLNIRNKKILIKLFMFHVEHEI